MAIGGYTRPSGRAARLDRLRSRSLAIHVRGATQPPPPVTAISCNGLPPPLCLELEARECVHVSALPFG